ncbi:MAG: hypothetical protein IJ901_02205 [Bacteroidaceae bacterium]|nr:hypothetical protein [Bacteroidaceae bacterium]
MDSSEWDELLQRCTWEWTTQNGVKGRLVTGPNGNSIFLPAAGYRNNDSIEYADYYGYYWSSSLNLEYNDYYAHYIFFFFASSYWDDSSYRVYGHSVRAVCP